MTMPVRRCALYTRKSSEEGLEQGFNSLDAQREACEAYVKSQAGEGWRSLTGRYDDGGFSGGSMERPALKRLMADIEAGGIDAVVVYKIDRLTRSLADFARMVELFERRQVSFVSVTQSFNTTTSMGRLTLNVLLSFAQFEREVTGERIRDKIAASKAKGMWMGGNLPLGYDAPDDGSRTLKVNEDEAALVRRIFADYQRLGSVHALQRHLADQGIRSKRRITTRGKVFGGSVFGRGALFHLLRNRIYRGMIVHKGKVHPGMHAAIVDEELFEAVQQSLDQQASRPRGKDGRIAPARLTGRIFDADGHPMCPTSARGRSGKLYRYYVSSPLQRGSTLERTSPRRVAAADLEEQISGILARVLAKPTANPLSLLTRVEIHADAIHLVMPQRHIGGMAGRLEDGEHVAADPADPASLRLIAVISLLRSGAGTELQLGDRRGQRRDAALIKALRAAHMMAQPGPDGLPLLAAAPDSPYLRKLVRLAFLSPDLQRAILDGDQPRALRLEHLMRSDLPADWSKQQGYLSALARRAGQPAIS